MYLQDGVSDSLWKDVNSFNYSFLLDLVTRLNWGEDVSNLLLVGMPDVVTPAHFDILENLYVQVGNSPVSRNLVVPPIFQGKILGNELNFEFAMTAE